jgi:hypothetical protein
MTITPIDLNSIVGVSKDQISSELAGEAVIMSLRNGMYYGLDEIGAEIWKLIQQPRPVAEVCDAIMQVYDVTPDVCERDVKALLSQLIAEGLIEVHHATTMATEPAEV